jgi:capsular exopolysaccharide synthesis family protein
MSRIHEALEKARRQQSGSTPELPNVEEIIAAGVPSPDPELAADIGPDDEPLDRLKTVEDRGEILEHCPQLNWPITGKALIFLADESHAAGQEQFRTLRSRLYQLRGSGSLKVIVVCSAIPGEGKSFVSANLAHAFALQSDRRALVVDADLRRAGGLSTLLEAPHTPGLTDYLLGEQSAADIIQTGSLKDLYLIPSGKRVPKPGELIGDSKLGTLIEQLRPLFDWIIIDTPPILPIADARMIADLSDGVLMVVNAPSTLAHLAKRAIKQFRRDSLVGVVLNRTLEPSASYYSAYGHGYGPDANSGVRSAHST